MQRIKFFFNLAAGFGNYVPFIKSKQLECQNTCLSLFLLHHFTAGLTCTSIFCFQMHNIKMEQTT